MIHARFNWRTAATTVFSLAALAMAILAPGWRQELQAENYAAVHIDGFGCGMLDGDGNGFAANGATTSLTNHGGIAKLTCKASGVPNTTGKAVRWNFANTGLPCGIPGDTIVTEDWQEVIDELGEATLQCRFRE